MSHRKNHEASVTSYVYEIRPKIFKEGLSTDVLTSADPRCQGTVKRDTKCHALKITKSPYSNCSKIGMMKSNTTNKKPPGVLHPSIKK